MTETRRLYYEDVYLREFTAEVKECRERKGGFAVLLDQSAFYPEGGGQPGDTGSMGEIRVTDTREEDGELLHYTEKPLEPGSRVSCAIDWERRFDLMQQHSGEHMVSGLVHQTYGYDNVGFHMGGDVITIDFNGMLTGEQLGELERRVNEKIWENEPVTVFYPDREKLDALDYRSKKELTGKVRLVSFPGTDLCACCGTHVSHTGEIGMVKLLSAEKFREGVRVEMICGRRVLAYLNMIERENHGISVLLSAKPDSTAQAVSRLKEESFRLKGRVMGLEEECFSLEAEKWSGKGNVLLFKTGLEADGVRRLADAVQNTCGGCCAVFSENGDNGFKYAIGEKDGDLREFTKELNKALDGRGGGKPFFVQGSVQAEEKRIREFFRQTGFLQ